MSSFEMTWKEAAVD